MTKADLKPGYLVRTKDDKLRMVMSTPSTKTLISEQGSWSGFNDYNDDLTHSTSKELDIIEVYGYNKWHYMGLTFDLDGRELLWEREKPKELTVDEISKLLGYQVKVVGNH